MSSNQMSSNKMSEKNTSDLVQSIPQDNINICLVGGVSTGKSTGLNSIFCQKLTECKIKRTTMVPTVYIENPNDANLTPAEMIYQQIAKKNADIISKTEKGSPTDITDYTELAFNVGKLDINIIDDAFVNVYDIPGLNDARTKSIYYNYLESNFHKFNLMVFFVDIHSGLNTSDEFDILNFIAENTKHQREHNNRQINTLVIVNKADDMQLDETDGSVNLTGELKEMFEQVKQTTTERFRDNNISESLVGIIPLCAIDAYLYRMVKKHRDDFKLSPEQILKIGINDSGKKFSTWTQQKQEQHVKEILNDSGFIDTMIKLSGFSRFESIIKDFLTKGDAGKRIRVDNLLYDMRKLPKVDCVNKTQLKSLVDEYMAIYNRIRQIDESQYKTLITEFVDELTLVLNKGVNSRSADPKKMIEYYDTFVYDILRPQLREHYMCDVYSQYLKDMVSKTICTLLDDGTTDADFVKYIGLLQKIDNFNRQIIGKIVKNAIKNPRDNQWMKFVNADDSQLVKILGCCVNIGSDISQFLRFLIINKVACFPELNMVRLMMYRRAGEIPISIFLERQPIDYSTEVIVKGLHSALITHSNFILDNFYLEYEKYDPLSPNLVVKNV